MPIYPGPGAGGGGSGDVTADPAITNWDAATDGYVLTSNGDATATFEAPTGGSSVKSPDGIKTTKRTERFDIRDYGANMSGTDYFATWATSAGTTTVTTKNSSAAAVTHDFNVDEYLYLINAGAPCAITAPALTFAGQPWGYATAGGTTYTFTVVAGTDTFTLSGSAPFSAGDPVRVSSSTTLPAGLAAATTYYVSKISATTGKFYNSSANAIAAGATGLVDLTDTGTGTHTMVGYTEFRYTARCQDGKNGWTAATAEMIAFGWAMNGQNTNYIDVHIPVAFGSHSIALYGRGTSSRTLMRVMDASAIRADGADMYPNNTGPATFNTPVESAALSTKLQISVNSSHGILAGDVVAVAFTSSGDTGFSAAMLVESVTATTIIFVAGTWNAGMTSGSGIYESMAVGYRDYGDEVPLQPNSYLSLRGNQNIDWHASRAYPMSDLILDSVNSRIWRIWEQEPGRMSGTVEPTWTGTAGAFVQDGDNLLRREVEFVPTNDTDGATNQGLWTQVASVPTASTFTTTNAATVDNATNKLYLQHNNATPLRNAVAATTTFGGGEVWIPEGICNCILADTTDSRFWTEYGGGPVQPQHTYLNLSLLSDLRKPTGVSIKASPAAIIRCLCTSAKERSELAVTATQTRTTVKSFVNVASRRVKIRGGIWKFEPYTAGVTEHLTTGAYDTGITFLSQGWSIPTTVPGTAGFNSAIHQATIYFPQFMIHNAISDNDGVRKMKFQCRDTWVHYGGGDGNGFGIPGGEFEFVGGGVQLERLNGSHGFYLNQPRSVINLHDFIMRYVGNGGKNCVQSRGSSGDAALKDVNISNIYFDRCTGPVRIGDSATSNRCVGWTISNLRGRVDLHIAEARNISVTGGDYARIYIQEDVDDLKIINVSCDTLELNATDRADRVKVIGAHIRTQLFMSKLYNSSLTDVTILNPCDVAAGINLVSGTYKWVVNPSAANEYYCTLRATGGDPGLSSPAIVLMRDKFVSQTAGTVNSLTDGQHGYGSGTWGFNTIVVRIDTAAGGGTSNPDSWPYGAVRTAALTSGGLGVNVQNEIGNVKITNLEIDQGLIDTNPIFGASPTFSAGMYDIEFLNCKFSQTALPGSGTGRLIDWSNGSDTPMVRCDNVKFKNCTFQMLPLAGTGVTRQLWRVYHVRGGGILFEECNFPSFTTLPSFTTTSTGGIKLKRCRFQTNVFTYDANAAGDTWIQQSGQPDFGITNPIPVSIKAGRTTSALPVCSPVIDTVTRYWISQVVGSVDKLYDTEAHAAAGGATGLIDVTTANGPVEITILDANKTDILPLYEFGGPTNTDAYEDCEGNLFRGFPYVIYPQIVANTDNMVIWHSMDEHHLSTDAARNITGFKAPCSGLRAKTMRFFNAGAFTITLKHAITSTARNQLTLPGAADFSWLAKTYVTLVYNVYLQNWVLVSNS